MRVLVVEDHTGLADRIADGLRDQGWAVDVAYDGSDALDKAALTPYDLVVLDRDLPMVHGDTVCAELVATCPDARILMLTAAAEIDERVEGLNLGADDYLPKPFAFAELVARLQALARRSPSTPPVITRGDLEVDRVRRRVRRAGRLISLSRKEFGVLEVLLAADGGVVSAEALMEKVWDEHTDAFSNTVAVTVGRLRRRLGPPDLIDTVVGAGYRLS